MKFKKFAEELQKRSDEKKVKLEQQADALESFKAELDVQVASINSELLKAKQQIKNTQKAMDDNLYSISPNLDEWDKLNARSKTEAKKVEALEELKSTRESMLSQMF